MEIRSPRVPHGPETYHEPCHDVEFLDRFFSSRYQKALDLQLYQSPHSWHRLTQLRTSTEPHVDLNLKHS